MKLYYAKGACSITVRIILNEVGLEAEYESVDLKTKQTGTHKDFLTINPKGSVAALKLDNGEMLTENAVIMQYLADSAKATHLLPEVGNLSRYRVLEWLNYTTTELHKNFSPLFNPNVPPEVKENVFLPLIKTKLNYVNKQLERHPYLVGDEFTLPDAYLFAMLRWALHFKLELKGALATYFTKLGQRKSILQSLKEEE